MFVAVSGLSAGELKTFSIDGTAGLFFKSIPFSDPYYKESVLTGGLAIKGNRIFRSNLALMYDLSWSHLLTGKSEFDNGFSSTKADIEMSDYDICHYIHFSFCVGYALINSESFFLILGGGLSLDYTGWSFKNYDHYQQIFADGLLLKLNMGLRFSRSVFLDIGLETGYDFFAYLVGEDIYGNEYSEKYDDFSQLYILPTIGIGFVF